MAAEDTGAVAAAAPSAERPIRAAEVVGALSLATDLGTGQPLEHAFRTAVIAVRLGELAGASPQELVDTYYVALLHSAGCTSDGHEAAQLYGDDIVPRAAFALVDSGDPAEVLAFLRSNVGLGRDPELRATMVEQAITHGLPIARQTLAMHCEVAQRFAGWLGFSSGTQAALEHVFERWDGHGFPGVASGDGIPLPMLLHVARDVSVFLTATGPEEARAVVERRAGTAYEPGIAERAVRNLPDILDELDDPRMWEQVLEIEPFPQVWIAGERVDAAFRAIAAFTNLKSPWLRDHSTGVAELAEAAAWRMGLPAEAVTLVRRAALAHDLGRVGVSNAIWEKPGPLGFGEWERVRLHPHFSERAFAQSPALAPIGMVAGSHHERLDGSGYHRGTRAPALDRRRSPTADASASGGFLSVLTRGEPNPAIADDPGISAGTVCRIRAAATPLSSSKPRSHRIGRSPDAVRSRRAHARRVKQPRRAMTTTITKHPQATNDVSGTGGSGP